LKSKQQLTIEMVRETHQERQTAIRARLAEFAAVWQTNDDELLLQELVFCIFTANASARMGLRSVAAVKKHLLTATQEELSGILNGVHRFPNARAAYITTTREFLQTDCGLRLKEKLDSFSDSFERRDWLAQTRQIKGLGYKESSHFLRNIGYRGYAILDKHILNSMAELGFITDPKPPPNRIKYLATEVVLKQFAEHLEIDFDELDLVLWSIKTGEILK
jgi:N-glycosylase/DNA lyase